MDTRIYDGCGIMYPYFLKSRQIMYLRECCSCVVEESDKKTECTKNRYGNRTMSNCENYDFEKIRLSDIKVDASMSYIHKKYYSKNIWLLLDE